MSELLQPGDRVFEDCLSIHPGEWRRDVDSFRDDAGNFYHYPRIRFAFEDGLTVVRHVNEWRYRTIEGALEAAAEYIFAKNPAAPSREDAVKHLHA